MSCQNYTQETSTSLRIFDGYIIEESTDYGKTIYLQDTEGGQAVELKFLNDEITDLSFAEFGHVEVIGQYNAKYNFLFVDQIMDTRERLVIDDLKRNNQI